MKSSKLPMTITPLFFILGILSVDLSFDDCGRNGHIGAQSEEDCLELVSQYYYRMTHRPAVYDSIVVRGIILWCIFGILFQYIGIFKQNPVRYVSAHFMPMCFDGLSIVLLGFAKVILIDGLVKPAERAIAHSAKGINFTSNGLENDIKSFESLFEIIFGKKYSMRNCFNELISFIYYIHVALVVTILFCVLLQLVRSRIQRKKLD